MKRLKRWFIAFFLGQFLTLFKKDSRFKKWVIEKNWFEKVKHILDGLLDFNKELVDDAREHFDTQALEEHVHKWVVWVEEEHQRLLQEFETLKTKWTVVTSQLIWELQHRFDAFTHTALLVKEQITAFNVQEKIQELKKILESLAKQAKKQ